MKFLRLLLRCYFVGKPEGVLWNVSCFLFCFCCGTQKNAMWNKIGTNYPLKHQVRCRVVNYAILKGHSKVTAYKNAYHLVPQMELYWWRTAQFFLHILNRPQEVNFLFACKKVNWRFTQHYDCICQFIPKQPLLDKDKQHEIHRFLYGILSRIFLIYDLKKCRGNGVKYERVVKYSVY